MLCVCSVTDGDTDASWPASIFYGSAAFSPHTPDRLTHAVATDASAQSATWIVPEAGELQPCVQGEPGGERPPVRLDGMFAIPQVAERARLSLCQSKGGAIFTTAQPSLWSRVAPADSVAETITAGRL